MMRVRKGYGFLFKGGGALMAARIPSLSAAPPTSCGWKWKPPSTLRSRRNHAATDARRRLPRPGALPPLRALLVNIPAEVFRASAGTDWRLRLNFLQAQEAKPALSYDDAYGSRWRVLKYLQKKAGKTLELASNRQGKIKRCFKDLIYFR